MFDGWPNYDLDKVFYYDTKQVVRIRDRYLGFTLNFLKALMWAYIILGVFYYGEGYLSYDMAHGAVVTHVKGDAVAISTNHGGKRYYSAEEITTPSLENGNVFVATRETLTQQTRGVCENKDKRCEKDSDCTAHLGGTCTKSGYCHETGWCIKEGTDPDMYDLDTMNIEIWVKHFVHYGLLDKKAQMDMLQWLLRKVDFLEGGGGRKEPPFIYSTTNQNHTRPERGYNLFSVNELLRICKPVPVRYEEIAELGAAIEVVFSWRCHMGNHDCEPIIKARRLDVLFDPEHIGFAFKRADYLSENERVLHELRGVRIFFQSVGKGSMVDINAFILKLATTTSLLCLAPIIADLLMLKIFSKQRRYYARKYQKTQNFSDVIGNIQENTSRRKDVGRERSSEEKELDKEEERFNKRIREEESDDD